MAVIRWSLRAVGDLESICDYIAKDSEHYARVFAQKVMEIVESLADLPLSGRVVPEYNTKELRERIFQNYRIVYRVSSSGMIEIVSICHGAKPIPRM
ncbi:MAG: type II toxin-antitoxin system RelE/ParE family toxin [Firmicutes bacterium]|nr:type II toxin-antitoxin system RelE/ParE family toxin [Bacillota bacterium]